MRELTGSLRQHQLQSRLLTTKFYSDILFSSTASALENTCAELFVSAESYTDGDVIKTKGDAYLTLNKFCREIGIPQVLVTDGAKEQYF